MNRENEDRLNASPTVVIRRKIPHEPLAEKKLEAGVAGGVPNLSLPTPFARQLHPGDPRHFPTAGFLRLRMHLDHLLSGGAVSWLDLDETRRFGDRQAPSPGSPTTCR